MEVKKSISYLICMHFVSTETERLQKKSIIGLRGTTMFCNFSSTGVLQMKPQTTN